MASDVQGPGDARSVAVDGAAGPPLKRTLGRKMLLFLVLGDILGAGIYTLTGRVAGEVGGAIWLPFLVAFTLAACSAASYAELVGKYPQAAGAALYAHKAFRQPMLTFVLAFAVMASGITSASAAARAFGGTYLAEFVTLPRLLVALAFLGMLALINLRGISDSARVNLGLTLIELTGLVVIIVIGAAALASGDGEPSRAFVLETDGASLLAVLAGTSLAFFALLGFEDSVNLAEETKEPHRNFPVALFGGLAAAGLVYLSVAFFCAMLVPTATLVESDGPLLEVVKAGGLDFPPKLFALIALVAVTNTALINMLMASRVVYGMSRQRIIPAGLSKVSSRNAPVVAIALTTALAAVLVATGDLTQLAATTVLLLLGAFAMVNISALVLRKQPVDRPHFRAPAIVPAIGAFASLVLMTPVTGRESGVYVRAGALILLGLVLYGVNRWWLARSGQVPPSGDAVLAVEG